MRSGCEDAAARRAALAEALRAMHARPAGTIPKAAMRELLDCSLVDLAMLGAELAEADELADVNVAELRVTEATIAATIAALFLALSEQTCFVVRDPEHIIQVTAHEVLDWSDDEPPKPAREPSPPPEVEPGPIVHYIEAVAREAQAAAEAISSAEGMPDVAPGLVCRDVVLDALDPCFDAINNLRGVLADGAAGEASR